MHILLTGASGHLGRVIFSGLSAAGHTVLGTDLHPTPNPPGRFVLADLMDPQAVTALIDGCDAVVHLGNHAHPHVAIPWDRLYLDNVTMNTHVFRAAADAGVTRVIYSSSIQVIAGDRRGDEAHKPSCIQRLPLDGWSRPCPGSSYALSKLAGEDLLKLLAYRHPDRSFTAVRFPYLVDSSGATSAGQHPPIKPGRRSLADEAFSYLTKPDALTLILAILDKALPGYHQYMPCGGNYLGLSPTEVIEKYYTGVRLTTGIQAMDRLVDLRQVRDDLGWEPREMDIFGPCRETV